LQTGDAYTSVFLTRSHAVSYLRNTSDLSVGGTVKVANDGGFKTTTFAQPGDTDYPTRVPITFWVDEERTTTTTIYAIVSNANPPTLSINPILVHFDPGTTLDGPALLTGVTAHDTEDLDITSRVTYDAADVAALTAGTNILGFYDVHYSVTDSDNNTVTGVRTYTNLDVNGNYAFKAFDFVSTVAEVTAVGTATDALILDASFTEVTQIVATVDADGNGTVKKTLWTPAITAWHPIVQDNGGFAAVVNAYNIKIGVDPETGTIYDPSKPKAIIGEVITKDIIDRGPDTGDTKYTVGADHATIRLSEVANFVGLTPTVKASLISRAEAVAWIFNPGKADYDVDVSANAITNVTRAELDAATAAGTPIVFDVTFIAKGQPTVDATVHFTVIYGNLPTITDDGPLIISATETPVPQYREQLIAGVTANDIDDGPLTSLVVIKDPATGQLPAIDTTKPGVYPATYSVVDSDGNPASLTRSIIVDDGRYELVDEDGDGKIDIILGAKNFVKKQADVVGTFTEARNLSYVEAYSSDAVNLFTSVRLTYDLTDPFAVPTGYANRQIGVHDFTWTIVGHPTVLKSITGEIVSNDFTVDPGDKSSSYALIAKDFSVNTRVAATINTEQKYVDYAQARVVKLVDAAPTKIARVADYGGFKAEQGDYQIKYVVEGIASNILSVTITGTVTDGAKPEIFTDVPIIIPIAPAGSAPIDLAQIVVAGNVTASDLEDSAAGLPLPITAINVITGQSPSLQADQPAVYPVKFTVTDSDGNTVEKQVAVVIDDGNFSFGGGFILHAGSFDIDLNDVSTTGAIAQIKEQSNAQAWRNDGIEIPAAVVATGGYTNAAGIYLPTLGIYDTAGSIGTGSPALSKQITANVVDTNNRFTVTFNPNGGALTGPSQITIARAPYVLPYLPSSPIRQAYTFRGWYTSPTGGAQFTASTTLTGNTTVYAQWDLIPVTPPPNPPIVNVYPPATGGTTVVNNEGDSYVTIEPESETTTTPEEEPITIGEEEVARGNTEALTWSLFDLLAMLLTVLLLVAFAIKFFFDRPKKDEYEELPVDAQQWAAMTDEQRVQFQARRDAEYEAWYAEHEKNENRPKSLFVNLPVLLIAATAVVEALILWFTTQDFGTNMVVVDGYSVLFALILFVQLLAPMVAAILRNNKNANKDQAEQQQQTAKPLGAQEGVTL
jgi:uncharacterized repeat protein (TIGR02543 family)